MQADIERRYPPDSYSYPTLKELVLDGCKLKTLTPDDSNFLSKFQNLVSLSCSCTGLTTLNGFPSFPSLKRLELQDNNFTFSNNQSSGLDQLSRVAPNLRVLRLGGNKLKSAEELIPYLKQLKSLEVIDVEKNLFSGGDSPDWRSIFFNELPQLKAVDYKDVSGKEYLDEDDDDDDEDASIEEDEGEDEDFDTLKAFYEKDYTGTGDDDDQDDFNPMGADDDDEDFDEDEELDDDDDENVAGNNGAEPSHKRSQPPDSEQQDVTKRQKI